MVNSASLALGSGPAAGASRWAASLAPPAEGAGQGGPVDLRAERHQDLLSLHNPCCKVATRASCTNQVRSRCSLSQARWAASGLLIPGDR